MFGDGDTLNANVRLIFDRLKKRLMKMATTIQTPYAVLNNYRQRLKWLKLTRKLKLQRQKELENYIICLLLSFHRVDQIWTSFL